jgi:AmmeMemoRadiSam system protein B
MNGMIRPSVIAGSWYPGDRNQLQRTIEGYFANVKTRAMGGRILGLISPHAGYAYSGQVAAYGYKQLIGQSYEIVVIVSPMHQMAIDRYIANEADYYETPLGKVAVAKDLLRLLQEKIGVSAIQRDAEHSLEIQLPFLQVALGEFTLLPIMVGHGDVFDCDDIVEALMTMMKGRDFLLVASTDLHHIDDYHEVVRKDAEVVKALSTFDLKKIRNVLARIDCSVCGRVPVSIVLDVTKRMGADKVVVLEQTNSGDVSGRKMPGEYTVGYLSAAIVKTV